MRMQLVELSQQKNNYFVKCNIILRVRYRTCMHTLTCRHVWNQNQTKGVVTQDTLSVTNDSSTMGKLNISVWCVTY